MIRSKISSRTITNFDLLLQDTRACLAENYTFYQECVVAITNAAARREVASAWFEQMQLLVEGVEAVSFSHAGVLFLLGEKIRGEAALGKTMLPPPLPNRKKSIPRRRKSTSVQEMDRHQDFAATAINTPLASSFSSSPKPTHKASSKENNSSPPSGLKEHSEDPLLYIDTALERTVRDFFGVPSCTNNTSTLQHGPSGSSGITYYDRKDTMISYNPTTDDLKDYKRRAEQLSAVKESEVLGRRRRGENIAGTPGVRRDLGLFNED